VSNRRQELLDAAIELVGRGGVRELTHRAVDAEARVPAGSTSNYFRTRDALLDALVERFAERERANWDEVTAALHPTTPKELGQAVAVYARDSVGPHRTLTLTRYAILLEGAHRPELRAKLTEVGARVEAWFVTWLRAVGSTDPERDLPIMANYVVGVVLHELANPAAVFDPTDQLVTLVESLVHGGSVHGGSVHKGRRR
jgi:DNA-binding transcriptional regulator YbjK